MIGSSTHVSTFDLLTGRNASTGASMTDWRDTFERFHDIRNQEETRQGMDATTRAAWAAVAAEAASLPDRIRHEAQRGTGPADLAAEERRPTTEEVREAYASEFDSIAGGYEPFPAIEREFDRWLNEERARIWDEGHKALPEHGNPYT